MTEDRDAPRMHPDDMAALVKAMREGPVRMPAQQNPPDVFTGVDAATMREMIRSAVEARVALFLPAEAIRTMIRDEAREIFRGIGLPIDDEHQTETADALRSVMKWNKRIDKVVVGMVMAVLTAIGYALLGLVGINLPSIPKAGPG